MQPNHLSQRANISQTCCDQDSEGLGLNTNSICQSMCCRSCQGYWMISGHLGVDRIKELKARNKNFHFMVKILFGYRRTAKIGWYQLLSRHTLTRSKSLYYCIGNAILQTTFCNCHARNFISLTVIVYLSGSGSGREVGWGGRLFDAWCLFEVGANSPVSN